MYILEEDGCISNKVLFGILGVVGVALFIWLYGMFHVEHSPSTPYEDRYILRMASGFALTDIIHLHIKKRVCDVDVCQYTICNKVSKNRCTVLKMRRPQVISFVVNPK